MVFPAPLKRNSYVELNRCAVEGKGPRLAAKTNLRRGLGFLMGDGSDHARRGGNARDVPPDELMAICNPNENGPPLCQHEWMKKVPALA
jgi:hypothetical protein